MTASQEAPARAPSVRDAKLLTWIGFPQPPHRIRHSRPTWLVRSMLFTLPALLFIIGFGILGAYFLGERAGRDLIVDSALFLGLGTEMPEATVEMKTCGYLSSRAGSKLSGHWICPLDIVVYGVRTDGAVVLAWREDALAPRGAGTLFGATGVYWPLDVMVNRWADLLPLLLFAAFPITGAIAALLWSPQTLNLAAARNGQVRAVDLLTWEGRPHFAFSDDDGRRRYQRAGAVMAPLILDGVRSMGAALVSGRRAVLLDSGLGPIEIDAATRTAILARVAEVQRECQIRSALPPRPGDPATEQDRIARIEAALKDRPDYAKLYDETWRLVWDAGVQDVADRALRARDIIAQKLGPARTADALEACRRRYAGQARG